MRPFFLVLIIGLISGINNRLLAQHEAVLPLEKNTILNRYAGLHSSAKLAKTIIDQPLAFPITEHFIRNKPDTLFWIDSQVTVVQKTAIFNAQNTAGATYNNNNGSKAVADQLTTKSLNFTDMAERCYISFDYETGATWQTGDSLVLQALNSAGNWDDIWYSVPINVSRRNESFSFPLGLLYQHASFQLRFSCYTRSQSANTETFRLYSFVFALKQELPFYENVLWDNTHTYRNTWSKMQGSITNGYNINWGNLIKLNGYDENEAPYNNGFNDTIHSHSFDLSELGSRDSVFFRFYYRAISTLANDSLIVQFKNNGGLWIDQIAISAAQSNSWNTFIDNVNRSRFNHDDFQYRIIARSNSTVSDTLKWLVSGFHIGKKLILPFIDDFSGTNVYPDQNKWIDKDVYINNNYPIAPPSINVATFDGLDRVGVPYGFGKGYCDMLTSQPIKLNHLTNADSSSIYLSFYIQPQGLGQPLDDSDSLILDARYSAASADSFNLLWRTGPAGLSKDEFTQIRILLPKVYWHDDFQLRFRNIGSRTGNLTHWHIDYVYLDKGRTSNDVIADVAIRDYPSPLLKTYTSVPYQHFKQSPSTFLTDTQYFAVNNNSLNQYAINYGREIFDQRDNRVDTFGNIFNNFSPQSTQIGTIKRAVNFTSILNTDSVVIHSRFYTKIGATNDDIGSNDTLWQQTYLGNYYAYDDGTAEAGYGILKGTGKVALRYTFNQPDSLYGMSVFYNRGVEDVSALSFNLMVWKTVVPEVELMTIPSRAVYYNARNGFHYIKFEQPVYVEGSVMIGWEQNQIFPLNVGLDLNHKVNYTYAPNPEMYYYVNGEWRPTELAGALMMRPIVGKWVDPPPVGLKQNQPVTLNVSVYPNPSNGRITLTANTPNKLGIKVYDVTGKEVFKTNNGTEFLDLEFLNNGLYFLSIEDTKTRARQVHKILISH